MKKSTRAFTLIELVLALFILSIVVAISSRVLMNVSKESHEASTINQIDSEHSMGVLSTTTFLRDTTLIKNYLSAANYSGIDDCFNGVGSACKNFTNLKFNFEKPGSLLTLNQKFSPQGSVCAGSSCSYERKVYGVPVCSTNQKCEGIQLVVETSSLQILTRPRISSLFVSSQSLNYKGLLGSCNNQFVVGIDTANRKVICGDLTMGLTPNSTCSTGAQGVDGACQNPNDISDWMNCSVGKNIAPLVYEGGGLSTLSSSCSTVSIPDINWTTCPDPPPFIDYSHDVSVSEFTGQIIQRFKLDDTTVTYSGSCLAKATYLPLTLSSGLSKCSQKTETNTGAGFTSTTKDVDCTSLFPKWPDLLSQLNSLNLDFEQFADGSTNISTKSIGGMTSSLSGKTFKLGANQSRSTTSSASEISELGTYKNGNVETDPAKILPPAIAVDAAGNVTISGYNGRGIQLTYPSTREFKMPNMKIGFMGSSYGYVAGAKITVPIGTYWLSNWARLQPAVKWDVAHNLPLITSLSTQTFNLEKSGDINDFASATSPSTKLGDKLTAKQLIDYGLIDNGFMMYTPDGTYLMLDAGTSVAGNPQFGSGIYASKIAKDGEDSYDAAYGFGKAGSPLSQGQTYKHTDPADPTKSLLLQPTPNTVFPRGSVLVIYDDSPDMTGQINYKDLVSSVEGGTFTSRGFVEIIWSTP